MSLRVDEGGNIPEEIKRLIWACFASLKKRVWLLKPSFYSLSKKYIFSENLINTWGLLWQNFIMVT